MFDRAQTRTQQLKEHLLRSIESSEIPPGGRLPSESQLVKSFALSRSSVRAVLAQLSTEGWVERRQGMGTFRTAGSPIPRTGRRSMIIGVWFDQPKGPLFGPIAEGIRQELGLWDYHAIFEQGGFEPGAEHRGITSLVQKQLDGFIVAPSLSKRVTEHAPLVELIRRKLPIVMVDRKLPGYNVDLVATTHELGAQEVTTYLIELGHRRIGFVGFSAHRTMSQRFSGFLDTMRSRGLAVDDAWIDMNEPIDLRGMGHTQMSRLATPGIERIIRLPPERRPTAIFAGNDKLAYTCAKIARDHRLSIPGDLSLAGFDNVAFDTESWLTTYAMPLVAIGRQAARLLMKRIKGRGEAGGTESLLLQGRLVVRKSTAPPPAEVEAAPSAEPMGKSLNMSPPDTPDENVILPGP